MLGALRRYRSTDGLIRFPEITVRLIQYRIERKHLNLFHELCGIPRDARESISILYPHVLVLSLQMVVLTHPLFPLPIWKVLQIRNRLLQHRPLKVDSLLDIHVRVAGQRVLEKGVEVDLATMIHTDGEVAWESLNTFYYRGSFGHAEAPSQWAESPGIPESVMDRWRVTQGGGWGFGEVSGDYNPVHLWDWYAKLLGFGRAFFHPQRVLGQCLARLPRLDVDQRQQLDVWLKGPIPYGADVTLRASTDNGHSVFALFAEDEKRPGIVGSYRDAAAL